MRKLIFDFVTAGVVGTSMIALPPALASSHSDETAKSVASSSSTQKSQDKDKYAKDKDKGDKDKDKDKHHGHHGHHCPYPTNDAHLSLSTASDESRVLTGTLKKNKCDLDDEDVDVFDAKSGKLVGTAVTNAKGSFTVSLRATGNGSYVA